MRTILPRNKDIFFGGSFAIPPTAEVLATLTRSAADIFHSEFPDASEAFTQGGIAIGRFESYLGGAGSFAPDGIPSWNFGAVRAHHGQDFITFSNGSKWAKFSNQREGILYWKKIMPTAALNALQKGDAKAVADAMFAAHYFGPEEYKNYEAAIVAHSKIVAGVLGETPKVFGKGSAVTIQPEPEKGNLLLAGAFLLTTAGSIWYTSKG
jgi:hypothetical protein